MKAVIAGGSGQVGTMIARAMHSDGHHVVVLSRRPSAAPWRIVKWDALNLGDWQRELEWADVVINLAGRNVNCRYHRANRRAIMNSRVDSTRAIAAAIAACASPPSVWLQASTATIYAHRFDAPNDEATGILGGAEADTPDSWQFSIDVAKAWERAATEAVPAGTRLVLLRSAMTMSADTGGIFDTLLGLVRRGLGGTCGDGRQFISWIHESDFLRAIDWLVVHEDVCGPVNLAAPEPLPNAEFMRVLREAWGTRVGLPAAPWMLAVGALFMRTETELILKSRRVVPARLLEAGFTFDYSDWPGAASDLCAQWRAKHAA